MTATEASPVLAVASRSVRSTHRLVSTSRGPPRSIRSRASASQGAPAAATSTATRPGACGLLIAGR